MRWQDFIVFWIQGRFLEMDIIGDLAWLARCGKVVLLRERELYRFGSR